MNICGGVNVAGGGNVVELPLAAEQACLIPNAALPLTLSNPSSEASVSLVAAATW
jgi:hypothetical protein